MSAPRSARTSMFRPRLLAGVLAFAASSVLSFGTPASAQQPAPAPGGGGGGGGGGMGTQGLNIDVGTLLKAKVGAWADYTMSGKGGEKPITVRYALVDRNDKKLSLEIDSTTPKGEMVIHFDFAPQGPDAWKVIGGKMQMGDRTIDIPPAQLASSGALKATDLPGTLVGPENITTPAGPYPCKHYAKSLGEGAVAPPAKAPTLDVWINDKVSPTGLVKSSMDSMGVTMTLVATGTGASAKLH